MGSKGFDYYIFIDYSENFIGYNIINQPSIKELMPKISRFRHYKRARDKLIYTKNIRNTFERDKILSYFVKTKVREMRENLEIFSDIAEFIKTNNNCAIFISVDDKQYPNFEKLVKIIDGENTKIIRESELRSGTTEYQVSLVLDNWLNIERLKSLRR